LTTGTWDEELNRPEQIFLLMPVGDSTVLMQNDLAAQKIHLKGIEETREPASQDSGLFHARLEQSTAALLTWHSLQHH
jgi:hypothetical protein